MDNVTTELSVLNNTNITCSTPLLWNQDAVNSRQSRLYICIIASIMHGMFWLQILFCSSVRQKSMQWIYAYLITDILLLFRFFFVYIVRTTSTECEPSRSWVLFMCYFEATVDNYFNILEVYILLALNICRYAQIAYNRNVYQVYKNILILTHLGIYFIALLVSFVPFVFGWTVLEEYIRDRCEISYTNVYIEVFNIIIGFALPVALNILVIYASVRHIRLRSTLRQTQHHVSAREKYHRSLVIQFLFFYIIWLGLWSPNIIVYQLTSGSSVITTTARLVNFIEIALDPIIIGALDVRFYHAWKKIWLHLKNKYLKCLQPQERQIRPIIIDPGIKRADKQQETTL
jgi:hypothetical protein